MHGVAVGMTLALGSTFLSQGCPLIGQCASCGACLPRLPLLAIPLAADAVVVLAGRLGARRGRPADTVEDAGDPGFLVTQDAAEPDNGEPLAVLTRTAG